jgi:glutathione S-transferase
MLRLCGFHISNYFNKVFIAMHEKGIAFESNADCRPSQEEAFLARTPMGKVPFLEVDGKTLVESDVICEYLEDAYPQKPLLPRDPLARAQVRELVTILELHVELVARRLYGEVFFGRPPLSEDAKKAVERDLGKGLRALQSRVKFAPYIAGAELTLADCAAAVHLPLVTLVTKRAFGRDYLEVMPQVRPYLEMVGKRPAFMKATEARKAAQAALARK